MHASQVDSKQELPAGCAEEVAIRAASIVAVEQLKQRVHQLLLLQTTQPAVHLASVHLDWWLWGEGERMRASHPPHHRTRTIYY